MDKQDQEKHPLRESLKPIDVLFDFVKKVLEKNGIIYVENPKYKQPPTPPK